MVHLRFAFRSFPILLLCAGILVSSGSFAHAQASETAVTDEELRIALSLAELLRASRTVVSGHQVLINDSERKDPAPDGPSVLADAIALLKANESSVPALIGQDSRLGRYLGLQADAIVEIITENRSVIDQPGVGFKGFVPAVFARLVNERFSEKAEGEARIKVTAPISLVRNRRSRPDGWERSVIEERFMSEEWTRGERHVDTVNLDGRSAFRVMVPEYYSEGCLACHGGPAGSLDITGHPKEGAKLGDLGGAISIALFR